MSGESRRSSGDSRRLSGESWRSSWEAHSNVPTGRIKPSPRWNRGVLKRQQIRAPTGRLMGGAASPQLFVICYWIFWGAMRFSIIHPTSPIFLGVLALEIPGRAFAAYPNNWANPAGPPILLAIPPPDPFDCACPLRRMGM